MNSTRPRYSLIVSDLDNTLYDWISYFIPSFYAMIDEVVSIVGCDREALLDDFRSVHKMYHDSEHPFALFETEIVRNHFRGRAPDEVKAQLDPALHAFNSVRKENLRLHSDVASTLRILTEHGITLVAHTESRLYAALGRLRRLGIDEYFTSIYCRERASSSHPDPQAALSWLRELPLKNVVELSQHQVKPDESVLLEICAREGFAPDETLYIGDSVARDVLMAKRAGVLAVWAAYGARHDPADYEKLVRISHWSVEDVEKEARLREEAREISPDFVCCHSFSEILDVLRINSLRPKT